MNDLSIKHTAALMEVGKLGSLYGKPTSIINMGSGQDSNPGPWRSPSLNPNHCTILLSLYKSMELLLTKLDLHMRLTFIY